MKSRVFLATIAVILALIATFVWPTQYRYDHAKTGSADLPIRFNRFTGMSEMYLPGSGWIKPKKATSDQTVGPKRLPPDDLTKVELRNTVLERDGRLKAYVYNRSTWIVEKLVIRLSVKNRQDLSTVLSKEYELTHPYFSEEPWTSHGEPLGMTYYDKDTGVRLQLGQTWEWTLVGASGRQE
jgi:hypothetical protein